MCLSYSSFEELRTDGVVGTTNEQKRHSGNKMPTERHRATRQNKVNRLALDKQLSNKKKQTYNVDPE